MKHFFKFTFPISLLLFVNCNVFGQQTDDYSKKIDSLIQLKSPRNFNGVILITQNSKTKYAKALGYSDFDKKIPLTLKDNFRIQSNSKQITAVLVLKEAEKGKVDLNKPIGKYLPNLKQTWADSVTVHQILNMSSGIVDMDKPLRFKPGTDFLYSNPSYGLLGQLIEKITGKKFIEVANNLFKDLGMKNTYCHERNTNSDLINGYWQTKDSIEVVNFKNLSFTDESWENFIPAGGIISNAIDLNIWDIKLHNGKILKTKSYIAMINSTIIDSDFTFSETKSNYGYGVNINEEKPYKYIGHAGRGLGYVSLKFYLPEKNLDVIILENIYNRDINIVYHFEKNIRQIVMNSTLVK
ncbi:serine hydrolase [uncultured Flavobacterium sp.]|uniref:serine hydrolase domain-containing protein n=1 Tax=uncultured Flavobacterium sp. TaxID=165435 RepID=UPI0025DA26ED|nr:serine hydrolase domain-containing protein [uncultured Flavobacterium sp.]